MDLFTPPPKKRKRIHPESPSPQRPSPTKKVKKGVLPTSRTTKNTGSETSVKARPTQKNAKAGPSKPRKTSSETTSSSNTPHSTRTSHKSHKKVSAQTKRTSTVEDSSSDPDRTPPRRILKQPKTPLRPKTGSTSSLKISKYYEPHKPGTPTSRNVVHLGALELTDSEDDHTTSKTPVKPVKRPKLKENSFIDSEIIDLCSSDEAESEKYTPVSSIKSLPPSKKVIVIDTSEDEVQDLPVTKRRRLASRSRTDIEETSDFPCETSASSPQWSASPSFELSASRLEPEGNSKAMTQSAAPERTVSADKEDPPTHIAREISRPSKQKEREEHVLALDDRRARRTDPSERRRYKTARARARLHSSCLSSPIVPRRTGPIIFPENLPTLDLNTPVFFARCISSIKASIQVAQKRARKQNARGLTIPSSSIDVSTTVDSSDPTKLTTIVPHDVSEITADGDTDTPVDQSSPPNIVSPENATIAVGPDKIPKEILASAQCLVHVIQSLKLSKKPDDTDNKAIPSDLSPMKSPITSSSEVEGTTEAMEVDTLILQTPKLDAEACKPSGIQGLSASSMCDTYDITSPPPPLSPSSPRLTGNESKDLPGSDSDTPLPITPSHQTATQLPSASSKLLETSLFDLKISDLGHPMIFDGAKVHVNDSDDDDDVSLSALEFVYPDEDVGA